MTYSIKRPAKAENLKERDRSVVLEIYVPVIHGGRQLGIVELYEAANELFLHIAARNRVVWQMVAGAGLILYCLLFAIFFAAHQRQKRAHHSLLRTQEAIITALAGQAEIRDLETGRHLERATAYVSLLLEELRKGPHRHSLPEQLCHEIRKSAPLHDIGKVGIPDAILCKSGELTKKEFDLMQRHCIYGEQVLRNAAAQLGFHSFLAVAASMARSHHERWDGGGYPDGLAGDAIPLAARVMALADVYDALRSSRCYKTGLDHAAARDIIIAERGRQFDPVIVDAFLAQEEAFAQVAASLPDSN